MNRFVRRSYRHRLRARCTVGNSAFVSRSYPKLRPWNGLWNPRGSRMIRMPHTRRLQHGDPVLEAQQVPLTNFLGTEPIVVAVVSIHHGVPKPVRFGLPGIRFRLTASLSRSLSAPFNSYADRGHRLSHVFGVRGTYPYGSKGGMSKMNAMGDEDGKADWIASKNSIDSYVNLAGYRCGNYSRC